MSVAAAKTVSVKLNPKMHSRIEHLAEVHQRTAHWVMREAIEQYVEREEEREALRRDALQAWTEYQETGLHVSGDEVIEWLDTWGEENEKTAPKCHA